LKTPLIVLNFKSYEESMGKKGLDLALSCQEVAQKTGVQIAVCPQMVDLAWIAKQVKIPVIAQHVDSFSPGSRTGWTVPESIKTSGAIGTLFNHSEHRLLLADIEEGVRRAKKMGLSTIVCTNNTSVSGAAAALGPEMIAIEPPELIGSGIPVSKAQPGIVQESVEAVKKINSRVKVLCGAGISTGDDVTAAIKLGTEGVLLASGVVKASYPKKALLDLAKGI
jgi:triosephosphate isomerase